VTPRQLATALAVAASAVAAAGQARGSPMSEATAQLACGGAAEATGAVARLEAARVGAYGLPDEQLGAAADEAAAAASASDAGAASASDLGDATGIDSVAYDALLNALGMARQRFPELSGRIDALVARWDFCTMTARGERWDLVQRDGVVRRQWPARISPVMGKGFAVWGLLPRRANGRPVWQGADRGSVLESGRGGGRCELGVVVQQTPGGPLPMVPPEEMEQDLACQGPPPPPPPEEPAAEMAGGDGATARRASTPREQRRGRGAPDDDAVEAAPSGVASAATRDGAAGLPGTISAQLTVTARGTVSAGAGVSVAPWRNVFARVGLSWRIATEGELEDATALEPTWSWGVGYDDWRAGTFSLQLNHWGPLRRGGGSAALEGAVADLGYKVPLPKWLARWMSLRGDLVTPLSWSPAVSAGISFKLPAACFLSLGISQKLAGDTGPTWTYVLGRSRWKPGTLALVLANYGPNQIDELRLRGLALTVSYSWKLP
jgi:hypothetical protein